MNEPTPPRVRALAERRAAARAARDFAAADAARDELAAMGWSVRDTPDGYEVERLARVAAVTPESIPSVLDEPPVRRISLHLLHEGFIEDLARFLESLRRTHDLDEVETVVVDPATGDGEAVAELIAGLPNGRGVFLDRDPGWAEARNAGLRTAAGRIVVLADLSIEPAGDILGPLAAALEQDPKLAVAGPVGIVTSDLRNWEPAATERCDAVEAYLLATRRDLLRDTGLLNPRFAWYRNADLDLSFQLREHAGGEAMIVQVPFVRHQHRGYARFEEGAERERRSRRNYNHFLDRWRNAGHLLTGAPAVD